MWTICGPLAWFIGTMRMAGSKAKSYPNTWQGVVQAAKDAGAVLDPAAAAGSRTGCRRSLGGARSGE